MSAAAPAFASPVLVLRSATHAHRSARTAVSARPRMAARGPTTPKPDYSAIDGNAANAFLTRVFRSKLEAELGAPASAAGYAGVVEVVLALTRRHRGDAAGLRAASRRVLTSLFPAWLLPAFRAMISRPMPNASAWLNAVVTIGVTQWLMGPSKLCDDGEPTVEIERCRYIEETGCVGVCINSCKSATEQFFIDDMALDLHIEPNLDDYSCKFHFGKAAPLPADDPMYAEPCFSMCPSAAAKTTAPCHAVGGQQQETAAPAEGVAEQ